MTSQGFLPEDVHFNTKAIHHSHEPEQWNSMSVIPPISLSTTFKQYGPGDPKTYEYSRSGNPSRDVLEKCLAALDNGKYGLCFSSGLGVITAMTHLLNAGDHVICMDDVYGGTRRYFSQLSVKFSISLSFVDLTRLENIKKYLKPATKMIWLESPTNPLMKVLDVESICRLVREYDKRIVIAVDNTFLTPYFHKPLNFGADVVVYSLTKYMNGHSDVVMGSMVTNDEDLFQRLKYIQNATGVIPSPFDCYLVDRSLKTLGIRMKTHMENGTAVARFLDKHPMVEQVLYPGLPSHPGHEVAKNQWSGCSGMMSFYLKGGLNESRFFIKSLKYFICAESLGGFESLVEIPSVMTHASVPEEERKALKITDNLIRLSVGLESADDLIQDLKTGLTAAANSKKIPDREVGDGDNDGVEETKSELDERRWKRFAGPPGDF